MPRNKELEWQRGCSATALRGLRVAENRLRLAYIDFESTAHTGIQENVREALELVSAIIDKLEEGTRDRELP